MNIIKQIKQLENNLKKEQIREARIQSLLETKECIDQNNFFERLIINYQYNLQIQSQIDPRDRYYNIR